MKPKSQLQRIIDILEERGSIDNFYCIDNRLTTRLAMHINLLRQRGYVIETNETPQKNCIYTLKSTPAPKQLELV